ncbi:MAG: hypothetical protein ACK4OM_03905 [Alphaproteobacteria bacterium]
MDFYLEIFPFAGQIWTSATCANAGVPTGCNGNGNYQINRISVSTDGQEHFRFWQHLSLANFLPGSYTGTSNLNDQFKSNAFPNAYFGTTYTNLYTFMNKSNILHIGNWKTISYTATFGLTTPNNAYSIDIKIDDGSANSGKFIGLDGEGAPSSGVCSNDYSNSNPSSNYNISNNQNYCRLKYIYD